MEMLSQIQVGASEAFSLISFFFFFLLSFSLTLSSPLPGLERRIKSSSEQTEGAKEREMEGELQ